MATAVREALAEPRVPTPPVRVWRDWPLVTVAATLAVAETLFRPDLMWRLPSLAVCLFALGTLMWRRSHPFEAFALAFAAINALGFAGFAAGHEEMAGLWSGAFVLVLVYSLFRWGSGREAGIGLVILLGVMILSVIIDFTGYGDLIGGFLVLSFPAELGAVVRFQRKSKQRGIHEIRLREREQLARELHDTVAHHVSAIAIQAQAGRAVGALNPEAACDALSTIEEEASRTLTELRLMVGALRESEDAELAPQRGLIDLHELATSGGSKLSVEVSLHGELSRVRPSVQAAIYRMAQESTTNAMRHARNAKTVSVRVVGDAEFVHLSVHDDGWVGALGANAPEGYGIVGMAERAKLLGGTFRAGPSEGGGWTVEAMLPSSGQASPATQSAGRNQTATGAST